MMGHEATPAAAQTMRRKQQHNPPGTAPHAAVSSLPRGEPRDLDDSSSGVSLPLWCFGALISEAVKPRVRRPRHQLCSRAEACFKSCGGPALMGAVGRRQPPAPEADESRRFKKHFLLVSGQ
ncbi:unnamed protein product [Arctogadus glacialis]